MEGLVLDPPGLYFTLRKVEVQQANAILYLKHGVSNRMRFSETNNTHHNKDTKSNGVSPPSKYAEQVDQQENSGEGDTKMSTKQDQPRPRTWFLRPAP